MTTTGAGLRYDPYDPEIDRDPYPVWRRLRDEAPLYHNDEHGFFALSRHDDVLAASTDWHTFSSARGTVLELIGDDMPTTTLFEPDVAFDMMIFMDPPGHDAFRRLVSRAFTPRRVAEREQRLRDMCEELLGPYAGGGELDFVDAVAGRVPAMIIGDLLGVPVEDQDQLRRWGDLVMRYDGAAPTPEKQAAADGMATYVKELIADRRAVARDDMVSDLVRAEVELEDGRVRRLTDEEARAFVGLLQIAGSETTARLLGWMAVLLARHPDERAKLLADPALVPNAVEELLRYEPPSPIQARQVTRDCEWYGRVVPRGAKVALLTGSAGRDERVFDDPDRFDVSRSFDRHLTFGYGVHYCLGANLARLEGRVVLEELLRRHPHWEVDEAGVELVRTSTVRGPERVPMRV